jgi:hypothetical protein
VGPGSLKWGWTILISEARLTQGVPWLCVSPSRAICLFDLRSAINMLVPVAHVNRKLLDGGQLSTSQPVRHQVATTSSHEAVLPSTYQYSKRIRGSPGSVLYPQRSVGSGDQFQIKKALDPAANWAYNFSAI